MKTTTRSGTGITHLKCSAVVNEETLRPSRALCRDPQSLHYPDSDECGKEGGTVCECTVEIMEANLCFYLVFPVRSAGEASSRKPQYTLCLYDSE
jgi:hypothetical protein